LPANLGQYGITYSHFIKLMSVFELPTYGVATDAFEPIRNFTDSWNENMVTTLLPGSILTIDESMGLWNDKGMPGWLFVSRKLTHVGRESHKTADRDTGAIILVEPYEGKDLMNDKEFVSTYGANHAKALRCVKPWFGSGRCVILDSVFASFKCIRGMTENGMYAIGHVKSAHVAFPRLG